MQHAWNTCEMGTNVLVAKPECKRPLRSRSRWKDDIKIYVGRILCVCVCVCVCVCTF
jgi:hypothetical protein